MQAIAKAGHEIAGMGYGFESIRTASEERERSIVRRASAMLKDIAGTKVQGWRCPDYRVSPQTIDILGEEGLIWDSSFLNDDLPYLFKCRSRTLVEIPFTTSTADKTFIGYPYPQRGGADGLASVWSNEFDVLYRESEKSPRMLTLSLQKWAASAPGRVLAQFWTALGGHEIRFALQRLGRLALECFGDETRLRVSMWNEKPYKKVSAGTGCPVADSNQRPSSVEEAMCVSDGPILFDYSERQYGARRGHGDC